MPTLARHGRVLTSSCPARGRPSSSLRC
jgi:hypothetical protein